MDSETQLDEVEMGRGFTEEEVDLAMQLSTALREKAKLEKNYLILLLFAADAAKEYIQLFKAFGNTDAKDPLKLVEQVKTTCDSMGDLASLMDKQFDAEIGLDRDKASETMKKLLDDWVESLGPEEVADLVKGRRNFSKNCAKDLCQGLAIWRGLIEEDK